MKLEQMPWTVRVAQKLRGMVDFIGRWGAWLSLPVIVITCIDVIGRKVAYEDDVTGRIHSLQGWLASNVGSFFQSTVLQELEWHFHAAIFSLWMGYCYTINAHPRVDSFTEGMTHRNRAWVELAGCLLLALPYMALVAYYSLDFVAQSYRLGEQSDSTVGLTHRWIIKGVYAIGLWLVVLGILSVLLRVIVFLFGNKSEEEVNLQIGHVETEV